jgi:hypothetical protein
LVCKYQKYMGFVQHPCMVRKFLILVGQVIDSASKIPNYGAEFQRRLPCKQASNLISLSVSPLQPRISYRPTM